MLLLFAASASLNQGWCCAGCKMHRDAMLLEATWAAAWCCLASSISAAAAEASTRYSKQQQQQHRGLSLAPPPLLLLRWVLFKLLLLDSLAAVQRACSSWSNLASCGVEVASQTPCSWPMRWVYVITGRRVHMVQDQGLAQQ